LPLDAQGLTPDPTYLRPIPEGSSYERDPGSRAR